MDDVQIIFMSMPPSVKGMVVKTFDDNGGDNYYTIVINSNLSHEQQLKTYEHEMRHLRRRDFECDLPVDSIERRNHG